MIGRGRSNYHRAKTMAKNKSCPPSAQLKKRQQEDTRSSAPSPRSPDTVSPETPTVLQADAKLE